MSHIPNEKQKSAYKKVMSAIKQANKAGLIFYGKCDKLVAYTKEAEQYIERIGFDNSLATGFDQIPCLSQSLLADSGADDYPSYINQSDSRFYSEY